MVGTHGNARAQCPGCGIFKCKKDLKNLQSHPCDIYAANLSHRVGFNNVSVRRVDALIDAHNHEITSKCDEVIKVLQDFIGRMYGGIFDLMKNEEN